MKPLLVLVLLPLMLAACGSESTLGGPRHPRTVLQLHDAATGSMAWSVELLPEANATEPVLADGMVFVTEEGEAAPASPGDPIIRSNRSAVARATADGRPLWRAGTGLPEAVGGGVAVFDSNNSVEARRLRDGKLLWHRGANVDVVRSRNGGALVVVEDPSQPSKAASCGSMANPCVATTRNSGPVRVSRLDPVTGKARWTVELQGHHYAFGAAVSSTLVLITHAGRDRVVALRLRDGSTAWTHPSEFFNNVTTSGEHVAVVHGEGRATKLRMATGEAAWRAEGDHFFGESPFVGHERGHGFLRDPVTGAVKTGRVPFTWGLAFHGDLLVGQAGSTLTAVRGGEEIWRSELIDGPRPISYLDTDGRYVAAVSAVDQEPSRD